MPLTRIVLLHGAATTANVWRYVVPLLAEFDVSCPERPCSGSLDVEVSALEPLCAGALVVGVSGGATLALELASRAKPLRAVLAHEPAAGSLAPTLLDAVATAYAEEGVAGFGRTLYGPAWSVSEAPSDMGRVGRDLAMFRGFEPSPVTADYPVIVSVGADSPPIRHDVSAAMRAALGVETLTLPGAGHAAHLAAPAAFARAIRDLATRVESRP